MITLSRSGFLILSLILLLLSAADSRRALAKPDPDSEPRYLSDSQTKSISLQRIDVSPFRFYAHPVWKPVIEEFKKSGILKTYIDYLKKEFGLEYYARKGTNDADAFVTYLFDGIPSMRKVGMADNAQLVQGAASMKYLYARFDKSVPRDYLIHTLLHEGVHHLHMRHCQQLIDKAKSPDDFPIGFYHLGHTWLYEGFAENADVAINPKARSEKYRMFYGYIVDKNYKPTFEKLVQPESVEENQKFYLAAGMMVEYLRLKFGTAKLRQIIDSQCLDPRQKYEDNLQKAIGVGPDKVWDDAFNHFKDKKKDYEAVMR